MQEFIGIADRQTRLACFLRTSLPHLPKKTILESIRYHGCRVNGRIERFESYKLHPGDRVCLQIIERSSAQLLWEDEHLCIYNKPAKQTSEALACQLHVHLVHRLDRDTSGCILFAKHEKAITPITQLFKTRQIDKRYIALVFGHPRQQSGIITTYTAPCHRRIGAVLFGNTDEKLGKKTITEWEVLTHYSKYALLLCRPITGRTHQIRLHMKTIGHPIVGDIDYGNKEQPKHVVRPLLHANSLCFISPFSKKKIEVSSLTPDTLYPFDADFKPQ
ncbi:RluA family pseudouridine synthase [Chlamydia muridarum str. Nigg]|uniref:Pseudouridine synthase n=1 Tax=Chlamydia muridarum TaxID=83560 RepID=A0A069ZZE4_CHLMR|nr:RluA family pseudouridine synthase [Chlamydia muridarum]UFT40120.1 RluA family pseudouridine synthase [Chlamydia trachomatis]AHH22768.1 pseudouridine synthase [Chlamydia muridarum str. Nigg3 CMUT3-5]AHH23693.1 pseudouridine synthase [Chlamydia muridarum str. Nigg CM972]AID37907.1 pseudouridine synthase [Chlamydia muridarum str. Nigg 2 MCR]AIT90574.1 pseudouridine synthase [Chlamydia muridarum]